MVELTDQEKLERRRQKRQQRILQASESRLSKITGTAFPNRATPSPTPSPSTSSIKTPEPSTSSIKTPEPSFRTQRRDSDDPSEELGAPQPINSQEEMMNQTFASMFGGIPGSEGMGFNPAALLGAMNGAGGEKDNEALQQLLSNANASSMFGGGGGEALVDPSIKYWNLLHLVMMAMLGIYSVYIEWTKGGSERFSALLSSNIGISNYPSIHVPLFWYFVTLELCMQSARMFYQQGTIAPTSTIATIATQLFPPLGNVITVGLRYRLIWTCLVQDICILIFIIGLSQVVSHVLLH